MLKVFQIGFNKCGTSTLHRYFTANGYRSVHWRKGLLARQMFANLSDGRPIMAGYDEYEAFTDMIYQSMDVMLEGYKLFPYLADQYPGAIFILNTRDREAWIRSRLRHRRGKFLENQKQYWRVESDEELAERWRQDWDEHHRRVLRFFSDGRYRFSSFNIETDPPEKINELIPEWDLDSSFYKRANSTVDRKSKFARRMARLRRMDIFPPKRAHDH